MITTVLDSNIFISAFLFDRKQRIILEYAIKGKYKINISDKILAEIETVLNRPKFKLSINHINLFINEIKSLCEICYPADSIINVCRDSKDHIILECAIESKSDFIITGDDFLLSLKKYKDVAIINSDFFLKIIEDTSINT